MKRRAAILEARRQNLSPCQVVARRRLTNEIAVLPAEHARQIRNREIRNREIRRQGDIY